MLLIIICVLLLIWTSNNKEKSDLLVSPDIIVQANSITNHADRITYTGDQLRQMGHSYLLNSMWRSVPNYPTLRTIKSLRINKRRIRFQNFRKKEQRTINFNNLADIPKDPSSSILNSKCFTFGTINARSIKSTINHILEVLTRESLDFLIVTETWLKDTDKCTSWLNASRSS